MTGTRTKLIEEKVEGQRKCGVPQTRTWLPPECSSSSSLSSSSSIKCQQREYIIYLFEM